MLLEPVAVPGEREHPVVVGGEQHGALGEGRAEGGQVVGERAPAVDLRAGHEAEPGEVAAVLAEPAALLVEPDDGDPGAAERAGDGEAGDVGVHDQRGDARQAGGEDLLSGECEHGPTVGGGVSGSTA